MFLSNLTEPGFLKRQFYSEPFFVTNLDENGCLQYLGLGSEMGFSNTVFMYISPPAGTG
jgi:hypothetical protein